MSIDNKKYERNKNIIEIASHNIDIENYCKNNTHSNNLYLKTYNNFYQPKIKRNKNKTPLSNLYKVKYNLRRKLTEQKNYIFNPSFSLLYDDQNYKDNLFLEVVRTQKNIKSINKELKVLQDDYNLIIQKNITYFYIFQRLLGNKEQNSNDEIISFEDYDNFNFSINNRIKSINAQYEEFNNKISVLKKQNNTCDLIIKENEAKLNELLKKHKQKKYIELLNLLYNKDNSIDELNKAINQYNYALYEVKSKSKFLNLRAQKYNYNINKLEKQLRNNNEMIYENNEEIKEFSEKKQHLRNSKKKWMYKIKLREKEIEELNKEENDIDKKLEENKKLFKEKEKNENILHNLKIQKEKFQMDINKIEKKRLILRNNYNGYNNELAPCTKEFAVLLKKTKASGQNKDIMKELEKDIEKYKNQIIKRDEIEGNEEKNMNNKFKEFVDLNNKYLNDISYYENEKNEFDKKINNLKNVLENNKNKKEKLEKEFMELEQCYEKYKEEYMNMQKEHEENKLKEKTENENKVNKSMKDNELKEKNYKEKQEKYNKEINELKEKNEILKKEKEELLKKYEEKMKDVKQMNEIDVKLKKTLEEIQRLTPS